MNSYTTPFPQSAIDHNVVMNITNELGKHPFSYQTDMGEEIYEWMDSQVENLSSVRLAEILRWMEPKSVDSYFVKAAKQVLIKRGHYELSRSWKAVGL